MSKAKVPVRRPIATPLDDAVDLPHALAGPALEAAAHLGRRDRGGPRHPGLRFPTR